MHLTKRLAGTFLMVIIWGWRSYRYLPGRVEGPEKPKYTVAYSGAPYNHISVPVAEAEKPSRETGKVSVGHEGRQNNVHGKRDLY